MWFISLFPDAGTGRQKSHHKHEGGWPPLSGFGSPEDSENHVMFFLPNIFLLKRTKVDSILSIRNPDVCATPRKEANANC